MPEPTRPRRMLVAIDESEVLAASVLAPVLVSAQPNTSYRTQLSKLQLQAGGGNPPRQHTQLVLWLVSLQLAPELHRAVPAHPLQADKRAFSWALENLSRPGTSCYLCSPTTLKLLVKQPPARAHHTCPERHQTAPRSCSQSSPAVPGGLLPGPQLSPAPPHPLLLPHVLNRTTARTQAMLSTCCASSQLANTLSSLPACRPSRRR